MTIMSTQPNAISPAIGLVKNGTRLPSESTMPRRNDTSSRGPSTRPSTSGAIG